MDENSVESACHIVPSKIASSFIEFSKKTGTHFKAKSPEEVTVAMCEHALGHAAHEISQLKYELKEANKPHCSESELETKYRNLVTEFRLSLNSSEDIRILKAKLLEIVTRSRQTREQCLEAQEEARKCKKMTDMVVCHLEKLVNHIKRESQLKAKQDENFRSTTVMLRQLKENYALLLRQLKSKNRYIAELQNGSGLLEDQLKLMDEKYLSLRCKLDHAREHGLRAQRKADAKLGTVMEKFAVVATEHGINMNAIDFTTASTVGGSRGYSSEGLEGGSVVSGLTRATSVSVLPATPIKRAQTAPGGGRGTNQNLSQTDKEVFDKLQVRKKEIRGKSRRALSGIFPADSFKAEPSPYKVQAQSFTPLLKAPSVEEKKADQDTAAVLGKIRKRQQKQEGRREWTSEDLHDLARGK
jgi:hypothetical protein